MKTNSKVLALCSMLLVIPLMGCDILQHNDSKDNVHSIEMMCSFSGDSKDTKTGSIHGYSIGYNNTGYVFGTSTYEVDASHYFIVGKIEDGDQYYLFDFGSNVTTFILAANQPKFNILSYRSDLAGDYSYYYYRDKNPGANEKDRVKLTQLSENEASIYMNFVESDIKEESTEIKSESTSTEADNEETSTEAKNEETSTEADNKETSTEMKNEEFSTKAENEETSAEITSKNE